MNYSDMERAQEDSNVAACRAVFSEAHPTENPDKAEDCDNGCWNCPKCPWGGNGNRS